MIRISAMNSASRPSVHSSSGTAKLAPTIACTRSLLSHSDGSAAISANRIDKLTSNAQNWASPCSMGTVVLMPRSYRLEIPLLLGPPA